MLLSCSSHFGRQQAIEQKLRDMRSVQQADRERCAAEMSKRSADRKVLLEGKVPAEWIGVMDDRVQDFPSHGTEVVVIRSNSPPRVQTRVNVDGLHATRT